MRFSSILLAISFVLRSSSVNGSGSASPKSNGRKFVPNRYFVIPEEHKATARLSDDLLDSVPQLDVFLDDLRSRFEDVGLAEMFHSELYQGMSVHVKEGTTMEDLLAMDGVKNVYPVGIIPHPGSIFDSTKSNPTDSLRRRSQAENQSKPRSSSGESNSSLSSDTFSPHVMTGIDALHAQGLYGKGVRICVIDTGVDYKNPILGGCFGTGCKISTGYDFVGDDGNTPSSDPYTQCDEHATHIMGTIGANANRFGFVGVAPEADLGIYRIFPCRSLGASEDLLVKALLRAEKDGCQVISASFSNGDTAWNDDYPPQTIINRMSEKGIVFVAASGNDATAGLFSGQNPAIIDSVLAVGSVDVDFFPRVFNLTVENNSSDPVRYLSLSPLPTNESLLVHFVSTSTSLDANNSACHPLPVDTPDLKNRVVVVQLVNDCNLVTQQVNLGEFNARYFIIHDISENTHAAEALYTSGVDQGTYLLGMAKDDGLKLLSYYQSNPNATLVNFRSQAPVAPTVPNPATGGLISSFVSYGPSNTLSNPGTIAVAPGGVILSTFPLDMNSEGVGILSGTSMSTPLVAGSAALLMASRSNDTLSSEQIRSLLATTTDPVSSRPGANSSTNTNGSKHLSSVLVQGGGLISAKRAYEAKTFISPYTLALNDSNSAQRSHQVTLTNKNSGPVTYTFDSVSAQTVSIFNESVSSQSGIPVVPPAVAGSAAVKFDPRTLTIEAGQNASVNVTITPPTDQQARFPFYSGFISIRGNDALQQHFYVSYFGLSARLSDAPMLSTDLADASTYGAKALRYPFVVVGSPNWDDTKLLDNTSRTASCKRSDGLTIIYRLKMPTRKVYLDVVPENTNFQPTVPVSISHTRRFVKRAANQSFNSTRTVGRISSSTNLDRDHVPNDNEQTTFNGKVYQNSSSKLTDLPKQTPYRILIRALKLTADPNLESSYDSYLSSPFELTD